MSDHSLTPGAERVLAEVMQRFQNDPAGLSPDRLLLLTLLTDEGRAGELLRRAGLNAETLISHEENPAAKTIHFVDWQRTLIRKSDRLAIRYSPGEPTGTDHLLLAAVEENSELALLLEQSGVDRKQLLSLFPEAEEKPVDGPEILQIRSAGVGTVDEASLRRILDAATNRCREGLRVVEDFVRFHLADGLLSSEIKEIRHQVTTIVRHLGQPEWVASRDSVNDVGARSDLASERERGSLTDVVRASMKRVEESLRSLEEYSKLIDAELSQRLSDCRFRFYTLEKVLEQSRHSRLCLENCRLYLLVTHELCRYGAETIIRQTIDVGVDAVQIREKGWPDRQLLDFAQKCRRWTRDAGTLLFINDRVDIAAAVGADGVHLGQEDLPVSEARKVLGGNGLIGVSTHSLEQAKTAIFDGADYLGVGPVFPSKTKEFEKYAGLEYVKQVAALTSLPWFAIGGINQETLAEAMAAGVQRIAVSGAICSAAHPRGVVRELRKHLQHREGEAPFEPQRR